MKKINTTATFLTILTLIFCCARCVSAQTEKIKGLPQPVKLSSPVLEWKKFDADAKGSDGKSYVGLTFAVSNWNVFSDKLFAAAPNLPACGTNQNAPRTWIDIYDYKTDKRIYGFCGLPKAEKMKSLAFNVSRENMPECIYITLTDRLTNKTLKSNPIAFTNGENNRCKEKPRTVID